MKVEKPDFSCEITAAVGFISPDSQPDSFIMQHNQKKGGWDIPGGHCDEGEAPVGTFIRETLEETNASITPEQCFEIARLSFGNGTGISVFDARCKDGEYSAINQVESDGDIDQVAVIPHDEAVSIYFGDKELLETLVNIVIDKRRKREAI